MGNILVGINLRFIRTKRNNHLDNEIDKFFFGQVSNLLTNSPNDPKFLFPIPLILKFPSGIFYFHKKEEISIPINKNYLSFIAFEGSEIGDIC